MEKIEFKTDGQETVSFYVLEQTVLGGVTYLLVTDKEEGDGEAWVMKDISSSDDEEAAYEMVEDDRELGAVSSVFSELLDDIDLES